MVSWRSPVAPPRALLAIHLLPRPDLLVNLSATAPVCAAFTGLNADASRCLCLLANGSWSLQTLHGSRHAQSLGPVYRSGPSWRGWSAALADEHAFFSLGTGTEVYAVERHLEGGHVRAAALSEHAQP